MRLKGAFKISIQGLSSNKTQSALTILGIVIGIASIIMIVTVGKGSEGLILNELGGLGAETIIIRPGQEPKGPTDIAETLFSDSLTNRDIEALKKTSNVPELVSVAPAVIVPGSVSYQGETFKPVIFGWSAQSMADFFNIYPIEGTLFTEADNKRKAAVAIIGDKVKEELFGQSDAVGENIKIKNKNFRVVGVLPKRGQTAFMNVDELVLLPVASAQSYLLGISHYHEVIVKTTGPEAVNRTVFDIEATLREAHGITDPDKDDFFLVTQQGVVDQVTTILSVLTIFLSAVVAIALVVGGVGVMNIMLVSVTERTREVGLRKAVGATHNDIMTQFLIESMVLTFLGGVIGVALGAGASFLIAYGITITQGLVWPFVFPLAAAAVATAISTLVGLIFGLYPARKAAKMHPIDA